MKKKILISILLIGILLTCGCENKKLEEYNEKIKNKPIVTMTIKDYGTIKMELYPDKAYNTVANFISLTEEGFYDNNTIHRVQSGFVLQGGDPTGTGSGGPGYTIKGEFSENGYDNDLSHTEGVLSMARSSENDSGGSQFFIMLSDDYASTLDGSYAAFGKVIEGMDIVHKIEEDVGTSENMGMLDEVITIEKTTVETNGYTYELQKIK